MIFSSIFALASVAATVPDQIIDIHFPVQGEVSFQDDYDYPRSGGRTHHATDIVAPKHTPVMAAQSGTVVFAPMEEPSYGFMIRIEGDDGYEYSYIHLNNDSVGTDDGLGGPELAYAEGIEQGVSVERGEVIGYVGDSGNAEETYAHLHFEIEKDGERLNPYLSLLAAQEENTIIVDETYPYDPVEEQNQATSISTSLNIGSNPSANDCEPDSLIKGEGFSAVYYCGTDGNRYVFQNESVYFSWYDDFSAVQTVTDEVLAKIHLAGVVTYKPGTFLVKTQSDPRVYAVSSESTLRWVSSAKVAEELYGTDWSDMVHDMPDSSFVKYSIGDPIF